MRDSMAASTAGGWGGPHEAYLPPHGYPLGPRLPPEQAPQTARSAAVGGGQQVRKIKRHFWFRGFATNIEIRYKTT